MFLTSLKDDKVRWPRLLILDNIEDKGMEEERSQNFQKLIVKSSEQASDIPHQIIFSTSKLDPNLEKTPLCVGDSYTVDNKALTII